MLRGLLMCSGYLTAFIIYGKKTGEKVPTNKMLGFSIANIFWLLCILLLVESKGETILSLIMSLAPVVAYPIIIAFFAIRERKKQANEVDSKVEEKNNFLYAKIHPITKKAPCEAGRFCVSFTSSPGR